MFVYGFSKAATRQAYIKEAAGYSFGFRMDKKIDDG